MKQNKIYGLRFDTIFKGIFGLEGNLRTFFQNIFHEKISKCIYIDKETFQENKYLSYSICDLLIETKEEYIIFEMQNQDFKNIEPRMIMYLSKIYAKQNPGKKYKKIKPVKIRLILNYPYGEKQILKEYLALEKNLLEKFGHYFDIKIWNIVEALNEKETIDYKYAIIFTLDQIPKKQAQKILNRFKLEKNFQTIIGQIKLYNADLKTYQKLKNEEEKQMKLEDVAQAYKEEGILIGEIRGKAQGEKRSLIKTTFAMLQKGFDVRLISEITGLSETEIAKFQKESIS